VSLLPQNASFEEVVQDCFLAYRGSGLMLNALEVELLTTWAREAVPVEIVVRGIRVAAEKAGWDARPDTPSLRSLRQCRRWVDAEIQRYRRASAGVGTRASEPSSPELLWQRQWLKRLETTAAAQPHLEKAIRALQNRLLSAAPETFEEAAHREELLWAQLARALPFPQRLTLLKDTALRMGDLVSPRARQLARRFHRSMLLKQALSISG